MRAARGVALRNPGLCTRGRALHGRTGAFRISRTWRSTLWRIGLFASPHGRSWPTFFWFVAISEQTIDDAVNLALGAMKDFTVCHSKRWRIALLERQLARAWFGISPVRGSFVV